jgi:S1-C subfamily serine protease
LKAGDIIEGVGQIEVSSPDDYSHAIRQYTAGDEIDFTIFRGGKKTRFELRGEDFPLEHGLRLARSVLGIEVAEIDDEMIGKYTLYTRTGVVVISVDRRQTLGKIGVQPGDVIRQIGERTIANLEEYKRAMRVIEMRRNLLFQIQRGPWASYVTVDVWRSQG